MNSPNSGPASTVSKRHLLEGTRTYIARRLIALGRRCTYLAEWIAPWL
jgi:hypothetical protein